MLFNVLPGNFFSVLSSKNKTLYWECIFKLFTITSKRLSFGLNRDDAIDELAFYLDSALAADLEFDENDFAEEQIGREACTTARDKASLILRHLTGCGWLSVETNNSNEKKVFFEDYAIEIIRTLLKVAKKERIEYQGYIYTIYNLARGSNENPGLALSQIFENTDKLVTGLKNLNSNIKKYIDDLTKYSTVAEIMENLLVDYKGEIIDKAFHRLVTADNVSKFRPEIVARLSAKIEDEYYIERAAKEFAEMNEITEEEAREMVFDLLGEIIDTFNNLDELIGEIIGRSTKYQKAAVNRARFLLTAKDDTQGMLREILFYLNEEVVRTETELHSIYEIEYIDELINLFKTEVLDAQSFYTPSEGKADFEPEALEDGALDRKTREKRYAAISRKLERVMSARKIESYVDEVLGDRESAQAAVFPHETAEEFVQLIYIRLYGQRKNLSFYVKPGEGNVDDDYASFRNFEIYRKKRTKDV